MSLFYFLVFINFFGIDIEILHNFFYNIHLFLLLWKGRVIKLISNQFNQQCKLIK